ncbi:MAG: histidinol-phosphate transaminase [Peptoniphilus sp.]|nr:histidinol-phosphate transaminase [Peptoniphilus sp.]MDY3118578.1 histidinol-phosphate transaminase [Peptoniphilus sp.]
MEHGGDTKSYEGKSAYPLVDFSANINPLGIPDALKDAMTRGLWDVSRYPDRLYRDLRGSLGQWMGVDGERLVVGNGAVEIIALCISLFERIYVPTPTFNEYEAIATDLDKEIFTYSMDHPFRLPVEDFIARMPEKALTILTNPNNPTGYTLSPKDVEAIYDACVAKKGYLLCDETFLSFVDGGEEAHQKGLYRQKQITVRAATKSHALAGIRLGWAVMNDSLRERFLRRQLPWSVNAVAASCGVMLGNCDDAMERSRRFVREEREKLLRMFERSTVAEALPGEANFLLLRLQGVRAEDCFNFFLHRGILLRTFSEVPLRDDYFRMAIRTEADNRRFCRGWVAFERSVSHVREEAHDH